MPQNAGHCHTDAEAMNLCGNGPRIYVPVLAAQGCSGSCVADNQNRHTGQHGHDADRKNQAQCIEKRDVGVIAQQSCRNTRSGGQAGAGPEIPELICALIAVAAVVSIIEVIVRDNHSGNGRNQDPQQIQNEEKASMMPRAPSSRARENTAIRPKNIPRKRPFVSLKSGRRRP